MTLIIWTYLAYLGISIALTVWVARTLHKNGRIFLVDCFHGNTELADSVNHLLVVGFCLINVNGSFTLPNGQSSTTLQGYNGTGQPSTGCGFLQGVNVGRADVYSSSLQGQWIDVTGVPTGQYFLEITLDGENAMQELDETNNAKTFAVTVSGNGTSGGIQPDQFDAGGQHNDTLATATNMGTMGTFTTTVDEVFRGNDTSESTRKK